MTPSAALLLALLAAPRAAADDYPIKPVEVVLHVAPDRVVADVTSDSIYWIEEVLGETSPPPSGWPAAARESAQNYANAHLRLFADGKPLTGRLIDASYVQRPWQVYEQGVIRLRLVYPAVPPGATISGRADFFGEYRAERLASREPLLPMMVFRTDLSVPGRRPHRFALTPESDSFSFPAADAEPGPLRRALAGLEAGVLTALETAGGWPALAALALSLGPALPSRRRA
ncbi:MAG: hypothetical protein KGM24_15380, partial [Elusimicrobia bacterium]|nr:hypothetical protein [Elusimicrobiota bacterium]